jgi:hypothetical protein
MYLKKIIIVGVISMGLFGCFKTSKEESFWKWFENNSDRLLASKNEAEQISEELTYELKKVNSNLVYEMAAIKIGVKTEFTISADGNKTAIDAVNKLYEKRPILKDWEIKAFRQRNNVIFNFEMNDLIINGDKTKYLLAKDQDSQKIGILLFFTNFTEDKRQIFERAANIFLDGIIGEYDAMTKIEFVEVSGYDSQYFSDSHPIEELPKEFDLYFK